MKPQPVSDKTPASARAIRPGAHFLQSTVQLRSANWAKITGLKWLGGLSTLTDANNNVTTWGLDLQGRVTSKKYADNSTITYTYETNTSRLHTMTDALTSVATYSYNVDNTLAGTSYTPASGVAATPNVSFSYDPVYNRVTGMTDGTGTTAYAYNAITGSSSLGAGRLHTVTTPIAGSSAVVKATPKEILKSASIRFD